MGISLMGINVVKHFGTHYCFLFVIHFRPANTLGRYPAEPKNESSL